MERVGRSQEESRQEDHYFGRIFVPVEPLRAPPDGRYK
jgi:hypothetical protein